MNESPPLFRREVLALVNHVELHRSGWWDKALSRLVLASIWLIGGTPSEANIQEILHDTFGLTIGPDKLAGILKLLENEDCLIRTSCQAYRIPDTKRNAFEKEIVSAEESERNAIIFFHSLVQISCPNLDATSVWKAFYKNILTPLVRDIGANAYRFVIGERVVPDSSYADHFVEQFDEEYHRSLRRLIPDFFVPQNDHVRNFITRLLNAQLCIDASGLSEQVLEKLKIATGKQLRFRLFVDTNFLFSLLSLHENPSNASAQELKELLVTLKSSPQVSLYVTPKTIVEAKSAIAAAKFQATGVPMSPNFCGAVLHVGISGMCERFFSERRLRGGNFTPSDWFDPYLNNFVPIARAAGVELFNENLDSYVTCQSVIDDINSVRNYEENKYPEERRKSYEKIAHDMILWHFVQDKRQVFVESPIDAQEWILTVDFRLLGFDQYKLRTTNSNVPLCIHPTSLIQLLQFWVPRTKEFEEAILGGLRLPFLFQEFDAHAERVSLDIIKRLGRFEGNENIPEETLVKVVMNDGLRARIEEGRPEEEEIQLVRDTLVEAMRIQAEKEKARVEELTAALQDKNAALTESKNDQTAKDVEILNLHMRLAEKEAKLQVANENLSRMSNAQSDLEARVAQIEEERLQRKALLTYFLFVILLIALSVIAGWQVARVIPGLSDVFGLFPISVMTGLCVFIALHLLLELFCGRYQRMTRLWPFRQVRRFRKWLWGIVIALLLGVAGSLIAGNLQQVKVAPISYEQYNPPILTDRSVAPPEVGSKP